MHPRWTRYAAWGAFGNAISSIAGFVGYSAAPGRGEPFRSLGYLAFVAWSVALLPMMLAFYQAPGRSSRPIRLFALLTGLGAVVAGSGLQFLLLLSVVTLEQTPAWNFGTAAAIGLWFILVHGHRGEFLPRGLRWLGIAIGVLWISAFALLGAAGFPTGGSRGSVTATFGFTADATAYFSSIVWAVCLGLVLLRAYGKMASESSRGEVTSPVLDTRAHFPQGPGRRSHHSGTPGRV
jgi:hypothetical protein